MASIPPSWPMGGFSWGWASTGEPRLERGVQTQQATATAADVEAGPADEMEAGQEQPGQEQPVHGQQGPGAEEPLGFQAERMRLAGGAEIDYASVALWLEQLSPYLFLLGAIFLVTFQSQLFQLLWLVTANIKVHKLLKQEQLAASKDRQLWQAAGSALLILSGVGLLMYCCSSLWLVSSLGLMWWAAPQYASASMPQTMLAVVMVDCLARLAVQLVKLCMALTAGRGTPAVASAAGGAASVSTAASVGMAGATLLGSEGPAGETPAAARFRLRQQAAVLAIVDLAGWLYREVLPIPFWTSFLRFHATPHVIFAHCLAGGYLASKTRDSAKTVTKLWGALRAVAGARLRVGRTATAAEVVAAGGQCPICHDVLSAPLRLTCTHLFCEDCVGEWLERHSTCPMCRVEVKPPHAQISVKESPLPRLF